jgi:hypothetical protein
LAAAVLLAAPPTPRPPQRAAAELKGMGLLQMNATAAFV